MLALIVSAGLVIGLDQWSKRAIVLKLAPEQTRWFGRYVQLRHAANKSLAGTSLNRCVLLCLWLGVAGCLIFLVQRGFFFTSSSAKIAIGAALGGSASNLHDHVRCQRVIDFLDIAGWPVFNLADAAIAAGALLSLCLMR